MTNGKKDGTMKVFSSRFGRQGQEEEKSKATLEKYMRDARA